jgi:hypothetical protein
MPSSESPAPDGPRAVIVAVERDFRALLELIDQTIGDHGQAAELAAIKATTDRGLRLTRQLLDSMDGKSTD